MKVGIGYDVHRLVEGRPLILGGVRIEHSHGLEGHSDADVVCHAIADACLGACALGDIGTHFPDTDPQYAGADSLTLLGRVGSLCAETGWVVGNTDTTIIAQAPRLAPHISEMVSRIARSLRCETGCVSIKATTTEHLGFTGRKEGIAAVTVVMMHPRS